MADHKPNNPFQHFQEGTQALLRHATQQLQQGADEIGKAFTHVVHRHARSLQNRQIQPLLPGMASISMGQRGWGRQSRQTEQALQPSEQPQQQEQAGPSRRAQPVADVGSGFHPDDIKARLSGIRVYVMTDDQDKIVFCKLHGTDNQSFVFFHFNKEAAHHLLKSMHTVDPSIARKVKIDEITMDHVYELMTKPRGDDLPKGTMFRFMPDAKEVNNAMRLYKENGMPISGFAGVPVFQAQGLSVRTAVDTSYVPLFLGKADLDLSMAATEANRRNKDLAFAREEATKDQRSLHHAQQALEIAKQADEPDKTELERLERRIDAYEAKIAANADKMLTAANKKPIVEVGCLEDVLATMERDTEGKWDNCMFVPIGLVKQRTEDNAAHEIKDHT
mmetsp:Transcript_6795/g.19615  ORF Transcript_6795/g.19615 Transcript_6795/m.19615 type:complete len:391 (-) Transcript_6795:1714-2886(-)